MEIPPQVFWDASDFLSGTTTGPFPFETDTILWTHVLGSGIVRWGMNIESAGVGDGIVNVRWRTVVGGAKEYADVITLDVDAVTAFQTLTARGPYGNGGGEKVSIGSTEEWTSLLLRYQLESGTVTTACNFTPFTVWQL